MIRKNYEPIHFETSISDVSKEKENPINPIRGISLLLWLREELKGKIEITEPDAEDGCWYTDLEWQGRNYLIGASAFFDEGDNPTDELEWVFQIDKYRNFKEKLFGKNKMTKEDRCFVFFKAFFENHPQISSVEAD